MKALQDNLSIDYRIIRVALASSDPIEAIHNINQGRYSIITLLDTLEMLDAKSTLEESELSRNKPQ